MAKDLTKAQLLELIAEKVPDSSANRVNTYMHAIYAVILEQLEINGEINIPGFGKFFVRHNSGGTRKGWDINESKYEIKKIDARNFISFKQADRFSYWINEGEFKYNSKKKTYRKERAGWNYVDAWRNATKSYEKRAAKYEQEEQTDEADVSED